VDESVIMDCGARFFAAKKSVCGYLMFVKIASKIGLQK
jgi:hypothetical protein